MPSVGIDVQARAGVGEGHEQVSLAEPETPADLCHGGLALHLSCAGIWGRIYPKWSEDGILVSVLSMVVLSHHPIYNNIGSGRFRKKGWARYRLPLDAPDDNHPKNHR